MINKTVDELENALTEFSDKLVLKTILENLTGEEVQKFLELLSAQKYAEADELVAEKIPDLDEKVGRDSQKRLRSIFEQING